MRRARMTICLTQNSQTKAHSPRAPFPPQTYPPHRPSMTFAQRMGQATGSVLKPAAPWTFRGLVAAKEDDDEYEDEDEDYSY